MATRDYHADREKAKIDDGFGGRPLGNIVYVSGLRPFGPCTLVGTSSGVYEWNGTSFTMVNDLQDAAWRFGVLGQRSERS